MMGLSCVSTIFVVVVEVFLNRTGSSEIYLYSRDLEAALSLLHSPR